MRVLSGIAVLVAVALLPGVTPRPAAAAAPPTAYLAPLEAHQARLRELRGEIDRLGGRGKPATPAEAKARAAEIQRAGTAYLAEARAFSKTLDGFVAGGTRRGLDAEVETIRATIGQVLATVDAYRALSGGTIQKPTARTQSELEADLRALLGTQIGRRIPNKLAAEGVRRMIEGASLQSVLRETVDRARQNAYATVDSRVRSVTGLGLRDLRDMKRAIRLRASLEVDRVVTRLLVRVTPNGLVVDLVRQLVVPWLKAQLTAAMRPHGNLDQRVGISIASLRKAANGLNALGPDARLATVHARWQDAQAALAATRFLVADIKRAHREALLAGDYGEALSGVERAMSLAQTRFLLHKEDLVQALSTDRNELRGLLGDLGYLAGHVVVPAAAGPASLEAELLRGGGTWTFGRVNGATLCRITFTKTPGKYGAFVLRACHPNESYWKLEGRTLFILHADGAKTSRLTRVNANYWQGPYLGHAPLPANGIVHYIRR